MIFIGQITPLTKEMGISRKINKRKLIWVLYIVCFIIKEEFSVGFQIIEEVSTNFI